MKSANHGNVPTRALQKVYEIALRAMQDDPTKYRQMLDDETGEPLGEFREIDEVFERVHRYFGLREPGWSKRTR